MSLGVGGRGKLSALSKKLISIETQNEKNAQTSNSTQLPFSESKWGSEELQVNYYVAMVTFPDWNNDVE